MKQDNRSSIVWQGTSWRLRAEEVALPDGSVSERAYIDHPGAVVLVPVQPLRESYQVLMLRQYRFALGEAILELPAGTRGWNEPWLDCAQRELREETGFRAARLSQLGEVWPAPGLSNELMRLYLADELTEDPLPADQDEEIELQPMPLFTLVDMALQGRLRDGKSIAGILMAHHSLSR